MQVRGYATCQDFSMARKRTVGFGQGQVNILATSDNHGKFEPLPGFYSNVANHTDEIFPDKDKKSTLNVGLFNGDWFMDPGRGGYQTDPTKKAGDYQLLFLNKLVGSIKNLVPNFNALYTPGNHCYDGGDKMLMNYLKKADVTTILTNSSPGQSPVLLNLTAEERKKIKQMKVLEVPDDKDPDKLHKVLVLGVIIPGVDFYNPGIMNDTHILDRSDKKDSKIAEKDLKTTYTVLDTVIKRFKKENPDGVVVLMSHTGNRISEMFAKHVPSIDIIFNGHDHEDVEAVYKGAKGQKTRIISLGDDSKKLDAVKIHFNDDGKYDNFDEESRKFYTKDAEILSNNPFSKMIDGMFKNDNEPYLYISGPEGMNSLTQKGVRTQNNMLANLVTDSILSSIKDIDPDVQAFGVASSAFRQDLPLNADTTNLQLRNVLIGQTDSLSKIYVGNLSGANVVRTVMDNMEDHMKDPERNTIVQWSGIQINKKELIKALKSDNADSVKDLCEFIKIKNKDGEYEKVDPSKTYKIALPNYFFMRPKLPTVKLHENNFAPLRDKLPENFVEDVICAREDSTDPMDEYDPPLSMDELLRRHINKNNNRLEIQNPDEVRIIT